jgi:hypothetical protein
MIDTPEYILSSTPVHPQLAWLRPGLGSAEMAELGPETLSRIPHDEWRVSTRRSSRVGLSDLSVDGFGTGYPCWKQTWLA